MSQPFSLIQPVQPKPFYVLYASIAGSSNLGMLTRFWNLDEVSNCRLCPHCTAKVMPNGVAVCQHLLYENGLLKVDPLRKALPEDRPETGWQFYDDNAEEPIESAAKDEAEEN